MQSITEFKDLKTLDLILEEASHNAAYAQAKGSVGGCGRVYIDLGKIRANSKIAKLLEKYFRFTSRPYYSYKCLYIGYDNATGYEWDRGQLIVDVLHSHNISAVLEGDSD